MLISPTSLIDMGKILKNISTKVRPVGLNNINNIKVVYRELTQEQRQRQGLSQKK